MHDLGTLGGFSSVANGISRDGRLIVGNSQPPTGGRPHAFLYTNGVMTDLGTLGGRSSNATSVNDSGAVVGASMITGIGPVTNQHAFLYTHGSMHDLGTLGLQVNISLATSINSHGEIVGGSYVDSGFEHAFRYVGGKMIDIGTLGGNFSEAEGINEAGEIAGFSLNTNGEQRSFLYSHGVMHDLGVIAKDTQNSATALNNRGDVVGFTTRASFGVGYAMLYHNGKMVDLNTLIPHNSGWVLQQATGINDEGQISGYGTNSQGKSAAFRLDPTGHGDDWGHH